MAPRREILDSEDEGDDFGSINEEDNDAQDHHNIEQPSLPPSDKTTRNSTGSTDPAFFQQIYEEQQAAAYAQDATTQATTPRKGTVAGEVDPWELPMSPPPATRSMGLGSASRSSGRMTRSSEKRSQPDQKSSPHHDPEADPYDFPSTADISPVRPSKRRKRNLKSSLPQQSHSCEAVQEAADLGWRIQGGQVPGPDSSMPPPTLPAMYIATSALTDSQKQQYQSVNISSQNEPENRDLAGINDIYPNNGLYKSSGATTIAYPTPSRFASSVPGGIISDALPDAATSKDSDDPVPTEPMSSPDELAGSAPTNRTESQATHKAGASSESESPVTSRRTRRRTSHVSYGGSFDEPIVLDNSQPPNEIFENYTLEFLCDQEWQPGNENGRNHTEDLETSAPAVPEPPLPRKKRGRKKKEQIIEEPILEEGVGDGILPSEESSKLELEAPLPLDELEEPPTKKRRGRPRKSDIAKSTANTTSQPKTQIRDDANDNYTVGPEEVAVNGGKRGRKAIKRNAKKKKVADEDDEDQGFELKQDLDEPEESRSLSDISHNPRPTRAAAEETNLSRVEKTPDDDGSVESKENSNNPQKKKEPGEEEDNKQPTIPGKATPAPASKVNPITPTPGKVHYRVGLSRNTRIAPLLKSLKK